MKDVLFLLGPYFQDRDGETCYCGDSVAVEGLLNFFPILRNRLDVHYLDAARPRAPIIELIGDNNQSLPVLILADPTATKDRTVKLTTAKGRAFIDSEADIRRYLSAQYGVGKAA